jgi:hypothetical protein
MAAGNKYEGGCFAIMVSEIGRTEEMEKLLLPGVTNRESSPPSSGKRYM